MDRASRAASLSLILAVLACTAPPQAAAGEGDGAGKKGKPEKAPWSVEDPGGPYRTFDMEATEGTWMCVDVSPDGKTLAFDLLGDVYTLPVEGGDATCIASGLPYEHQPRWSPDGKHIVFTSDRGGGDNLWTMDPDGGNKAAFTREEFRLFNEGSWHPSGDWVVGRKHFTSGRSLGAGEMWLVPFPDGGAGVQLTKRKNDQQDAGEPVFSPDGGFLYWSEDMSGGSTFEYNKDPNGSIYHVRRLDIATGEIRELIDRPGGAIRPQPSPDGKSLAFVRRVRDRSVLAVLDLATNAVRDLYDGMSLDQQETWAVFGPYPGYAWMPDGKSLVAWAKGKIRRIDAETGKATEIPFKAKVSQRLCPTCRTEGSLGGPTFEVKDIRWPQVTADGKTAVFQALGKIWLKELPDGRARRITKQEEDLEFAPRLDAAGHFPSELVIYTTWNDRTGGRVKQWYLTGGEPEVLVEWPGHYLSAVLSLDGDRLLVERGGPDAYRGRSFAEEPGLYLGSGPRGNANPLRPLKLLARAGRRPVLSPDGERVLFLEGEDERSALVSVDLKGKDRRVLATSEHATDFCLSPDGKWLAFEELWQTYVCPMPPARGPEPLHVGPEMKDYPVVRLSEVSGTYLSWSPDSTMVRWSLGPDLFETKVAALFPVKKPPEGESKAEAAKRPRGVGAKPIHLGWTEKADIPATDLWFTGATVLPMDDMSVIPDGVVHVVGNRIAAVGKKGELEVPAGATVIDCAGQTLMPGLVDVHSHHGSSEGGVCAQRSWALSAMLAFGVTTIHDPSNDTKGFYAEAELVQAGKRLGPRMLSTGTILYGAEGDFKAVINSYEDAREAVARTIAWGPRSVKSYQQPRREQRQQVLKACRDLGVLCVPEGGSTFCNNMTHILDGHTTLEHSIPVAPLYGPEVGLFAASGTSFTPTLVVGYGGLWGENWWYARTKVWEDERLLHFVPRSVVDPRARRRVVASDEEEYHHVRLARNAAAVYRAGGNVEIGGHGQMQGLGSHWETWCLAQGGLTPHEALRCATFGGAKAICLEKCLGSIRPGMLADLIVVEGKPLETVTDSEKVRWTMANGRLFDARTLDQVAPEKVPVQSGPALDTIPGEASNARCGCGQ
jgi:imidazolonepropionase-like amidohydrolase/Tol biopolymer transport system component